MFVGHWEATVFGVQLAGNVMELKWVVKIGKMTKVGES